MPNPNPEQAITELRTALALVLDNVDYERGACGLTEMVGAVLPSEILTRARKALETTKP